MRVTNGEYDEVEIRHARGDEAHALAAVQEAASVAAVGHVFPPDLYPFPRREVRARWAALLADPEAAVLVAVRADAAVGVAAVRPGWLDALYVRPEEWRRGFGARLHDEALALLRARGCARCDLWVLEGNTRARRFYERLGWVENGTSREVPFPPFPLDIGYTLALTGPT